MRQSASSIAVALLSFCMVAALGADDSQKSNPSTPKMDVSPKYNIGGIVTDAGGKPIAKAEVQVQELQCGAPVVPVVLTGRNGHFSMTGLPATVVYQWRTIILLKVSAKGFSPALLELPVQVNNNNLRIRLDPGHKIVGKVVDADGKPVQGAVAVALGWRNYNMMNVQIPTRADGRFEWDAAPADAVTFDFVKQGWRSIRGMSLAASDKEQVIVLKKPLAVTGRIVDAQTKAPITDYTLYDGVQWPDFNPNFGKPQKKHDPDGRYSLEIDEPAYLINTPSQYLQGAHLVKIEVPGYLPAVSRPIGNDEDRVEFDFALERTKDIVLLAQSPDGTPAAGADLVVGGVGNPLRVANGKPILTHGKITLTAGKDGRFQIPDQLENPPVVITHDSGLWRGKLDDLRHAQNISLTAWGSVSVETSPDVKPGGQCPFYINFRPLDTPHQHEDLYVDCNGTIAKPGLVVFEHVPPGPVRVGTYMEPDSEATELELKPGGTAAIERESDAMSCGGRVVLPGLKGVAWETLGADLTAKLPHPWPPGLTIQERRDWLDKWYTTGEGKAWKKRHHFYDADLDQNGAFSFNKVEPGTYNLEIGVYSKSPGDTAGRKLLGVINKEIKVPGRAEFQEIARQQGAADVPQSSFTFFVNITADDYFGLLQPKQDFPPLRLASLDGADVDTAKSGGADTLVVFWSSLIDWAPSFNDTLNKLADEFPATKLKIIGVNLDESRKQLDRFLAGHPAKWTQCFAGESAAPDLRKNYGPVTWTPIIYLIGPDGKVIANPEFRNVDQLETELEGLVSR